MKVLVTGAKGFTGRHLISQLQNTGEPGLELYSTSRDRDHGYGCDLSVFDQTCSLINQIKPDQIYHLAGSFTNHYDVDYANNVLSTKTIFDSLLKTDIPCRVLLVGTAAEYGLVNPEDNPVKESHPLSPISLYGLTKIYQTQLMQFYVQVHNLDVVMARTFNLLGKTISPQLFIGRIYQQVDAYRRGEIQSIVLGNLESKRDYIDIHEAVQWYQLIMNRGTRGEVYNVGSGFSVQLKEILNRILFENSLDMGVVESQPITHAHKINITDIFADISRVQSLKTRFT
jgi:GDP-4-dehydro-6-deoxy-D-mannose reductase